MRQDLREQLELRAARGQLVEMAHRVTLVRKELQVLKVQLEHKDQRVRKAHRGTSVLKVQPVLKGPKG